MDLQTNIERVENMLYYICGCNYKEGEIILKECLKRCQNETKKNNKGK